MSWTDEDNRLLATKCEGAIPVRDRDMPERLWKYRWPDGARGFLPNYNLDPAACLRAAEAWRKQHENASWTLGAGTWGRDTVTAQLTKGFVPQADCEAKDPAAALARALREAVRDA